MMKIAIISFSAAVVFIMYSCLAVRSEHDRQQDDEEQIKFIEQYNKEHRKGKKWK